MIVRQFFATLYRSAAGVSFWKAGDTIALGRRTLRVIDRLDEGTDGDSEVRRARSAARRRKRLAAPIRLGRNCSNRCRVFGLRNGVANAQLRGMRDTGGDA